MVQAWGQDQNHDGEGSQLPDDSVWQAKLWRRVAHRIPVPGPAERLKSACLRLRAE